MLIRRVLVMKGSHLGWLDGYEKIVRKKVQKVTFYIYSGRDAEVTPRLILN